MGPDRVGEHGGSPRPLVPSSPRPLVPSSPRPLVPSSPRPLVHGSCIEPETTNRADAPRSCGRSSCRLWGHTHVARLTPSFAGIGTPAVRPAAIHSSTSIAGVRRRPFRPTTFAALPTTAPRGVPGSGARVRVQGGAVRADRPLRDPAHAVAFTTAVAVGGTGSVHRRTGMRTAPTLPGGEGSRPGSLPATDCPPQAKLGFSRLPRKVFPYVPGVCDRAGSRGASRYRRPGCGLPHPPTASAPQSNSFRGSIPGPHVPLSTLHPRPRGRRCMTRGRRGSLTLRRMTLPFTTPCRFVPAQRRIE